jgi:ribosome-associated inhibitor A
MSMTISIQFVKMPGSDALTAYASKKIQKLGDRYDWIISAEVFFKIDKNDSRISKICEVELSAPGPRIFASASEKNFEMAVKETVSELEKQLKKRKSIMIHH